MFLTNHKMSKVQTILYMCYRFSGLPLWILWAVNTQVSVWLLHMLSRLHLGQAGPYLHACISSRIVAGHWTPEEEDDDPPMS